MKFTKAIIFPLTAKFGPALVLALVACSVTFAQDVRTNYMPGTDFSRYRTYAWVDEVQGVPTVGGHVDQILDTQVKQAIDSQMAAKGFTKVADGGKARFASWLPAHDRSGEADKRLRRQRLGRLGRLGPVGRRLRFIFGEYFNQLTSGLSSLVCMILLQRSSFG